MRHEWVQDAVGGETVVLAVGDVVVAVVQVA